MSPPDRHVTVEPHGPGRLLVVITRRQTRAFSLSMDEAAMLHGELGKYLPAVSTRQLKAAEAAVTK